MGYEVIPTGHFNARAKQLAKHYHSFKDELQSLVNTLKKEPLIGDDLGGGLRKIRMKVGSKGKGKRGGIRVIEFIAYCDKEVYLLTAYDKSAIENISTKNLKKLVASIEEI